MRVQALSDLTPWREAFGVLDVDEVGINILEKKSSMCVFKIEKLKTPAANILKQDALSVGADVATPRSVIVCGEKEVDVVLLGTPRHLEALCRKLLAQPFGLKEVAHTLKSFLHPKTFPRQIMGVLNVNSDSFFHASRVDESSVMTHVEQMIEDGAHIIDMGAVSSRPGSLYPGVDEEFARIEKIINLLHTEKIYEKVSLSLDTFEPKVAHYALERGFTIINDITGLANPEMISLCATFGAKAVMMHMEGTPQTMQENPCYENVVLEVDRFFEERLEKAYALGLNDIVLDVGIGFGKSLSHNLSLIKHLGHFKRFGLPLLIGASRKRMIDVLSPSGVDERLGGTLALHLEALRQGAAIVRCHDVKEHIQALRVMDALSNTVF